MPSWQFRSIHVDCLGVPPPRCLVNQLDVGERGVRLLIKLEETEPHSHSNTAAVPKGWICSDADR